MEPRLFFIFLFMKLARGQVNFDELSADLYPSSSRADYDNAFCKSVITPGYVHVGCCSSVLPSSHCFVNDWETRDVFCATQNLHANRFSYKCPWFTRNCTLPKGTCYCCSPDAETVPDNWPTRPPPNPETDSSFCGTITTEYFGGDNQTLLHVTEETELLEMHFDAVSKALRGGKKYINLINDRCKISICHTYEKYFPECLHFHQGGSSSYSTDHNASTTSISCGCLDTARAKSQCEITSVSEHSSIIQSQDDSLQCPSRTLGDETCAILFQERECQSCFYKEIRLTVKHKTAFTPSNYAVIRSIQVNEGCSVRGFALDGYQQFDETTANVPEFYSRYDVSGTVYTPFTSFGCTCEPKSSIPSGIIAGIGVAALLIIVLLGYIVMRKRKQKVKFTESETEELKFELFGERDATADENSEDPEAAVNSNNGGVCVDYSIKKENIEVLKDQLLGKGNYGVVFKGSLFSEVDQSRCACAVKTVDERTARIDDLKLLMNEIRIMSAVGHHENVVSFLGFYCNFHPSKWEFLCLMDLCMGSLHDLLRQERSHCAQVTPVLKKGGYVAFFDDSLAASMETVPVNTMNITLARMRQWCAEIADGMNYLICKNILHVDLATRNVLLSADLTAKISDFGLSKKLYDSVYYKTAGGNVWTPMKWSSFESLMSLRFSSQSDIWSYGVTIWEIFSLGDEPYPKVGEMLELIRLLNSGQRLPCPEGCDLGTYTLMQQCWQIDATLRPNFEEIYNFFKKVEN